MATHLHLIRTSSWDFSKRPTFRSVGDETRRVPPLWNLKRGPIATTVGLLILAIGVSFAYLFAANTSSSYSYQLKALEAQAYDLRVEQDRLSAEATRLKSVQALHDPRIVIPGVAVSNATYLPPIPDNVALK